MNQAFSTKTYGKWIFSGEHSVLRGSPALVFPLKSKALTLSFRPQKSGLDLVIDDQHGPEFKVLFYSLLEKSCELSGHHIQDIQGQFHFSSAIPVGAGLGASAALCAAVTRFFESQGWVESAQLVSFARTLENIFHGESSGVDVAVALSEVGLHFERSGRQYPLNPTWQPVCGIIHTGQKGMTYDCVLKVKELIKNNPNLGAQLDQQMRESVILAEAALLVSEFSELALLDLKKSVDMAEDCFEQWGLITPEMKTMSQSLKKLGALAVKPTGSGGGGYLLSLWDRPWPDSLNAQILNCF